MNYAAAMQLEIAEVCKLLLALGVLFHLRSRRGSAECICENAAYQEGKQRNYLCGSEPWHNLKTLTVAIHGEAEPLRRFGL